MTRSAPESGGREATAWSGAPSVGQKRSTLSNIRGVPQGARIHPASPRLGRRQVARLDNQAWRHAAACQKVDQELFFPSGPAAGTGPGTERAKAVCTYCPVQLPCLRFALATNQEFGVWGGYDEHERRRLRRLWRAASDVSPDLCPPAS